VAARLVALAASEGASVADAFLSVALSFLQSWSGESELAIAVSVPDRVIPADVVGARTHAVPLRVPVGTWMTFRALLRSVGDAAATAGQQGAFDGLPAEVVYSFRDIAHPAIEVLSHGRRGIARASLAFAATRTPDGVSMSLEYDASTYDAGQAAQLGAQLSNVARAASLDPDRPLGALELLTADDHARLAAWTTAAMPLPQDRTLHELLSRHAAARGSAVAIVAGETELTYAEWEARANQLARLLAARGVCAEGRVALLLPRSPEFLVALMAVWKAGAAFVPMDPEQPRARLDAVLANAGVQCAVTLELHADVVGDVPVILLDRDADDIAAESTAPLAVRSDPEDLAYIIYTSGSTGVPKGVMVPHRGLPNLAEAARRIHGLTPESRVALFGSFSFDASIADVAMALAPGATLCILPTRELAGEALLDALRRDRATIVTIPPSVLATVPFGPLPDLETLIVAGEACPLELARQWGRGRRLHNCYGPTEATVWATWERFDDEGTLGIGVPVPNTRVHVLDRMLRPVAPGLTGELFLGGINVARAYARQPALTAERFVPDPFAEQPGMRLYRTGDLVRHRPDGRLEFLGRADDQVKIRGWRIEPGEVAAMLRHHPDVTNAAVVAAAGRDGSTQLAACVTVRGAVTADAIRAWTRERLPGPMVPSAIAIVEAIPLSPNGKIDRDAVRRMARHSAPTEQFVAGESTEAALVAIWNELLDRPPASAGDNFFDLGGHSLLATRLLARVRQALDVDIPLRAFFENPTIAGMARSIREPEVRR
jgi:amino acid adenylation domain-containing protein